MDPNSWEIGSFYDAYDLTGSHGLPSWRICKLRLVKRDAITVEFPEFKGELISYPLKLSSYYVKPLGSYTLVSRKIEACQLSQLPSSKHSPSHSPSHSSSKWIAIENAIVTSFNSRRRTHSIVYPDQLKVTIEGELRGAQLVDHPRKWKERIQSEPLMTQIDGSDICVGELYDVLDLDAKTIAALSFSVAEGRSTVDRDAMRPWRIARVVDMDFSNVTLSWIEFPDSLITVRRHQVPYRIAHLGHATRVDSFWILEDGQACVVTDYLSTSGLFTVKTIGERREVVVTDLLKADFVPAEMLNHGHITSSSVAGLAGSSDVGSIPSTAVDVLGSSLLSIRRSQLHTYGQICLDGTWVLMPDRLKGLRCIIPVDAVGDTRRTGSTGRDSAPAAYSSYIVCDFDIRSKRYLCFDNTRGVYRFVEASVIEDIVEVTNLDAELVGRSIGRFNSELMVWECGRVDRYFSNGFHAVSLQVLGSKDTPTQVLHVNLNSMTSRDSWIIFGTNVLSGIDFVCMRLKVLLPRDDTSTLAAYDMSTVYVIKYTKETRIHTLLVESTGAVRHINLDESSWLYANNASIGMVVEPGVSSLLNLADNESDDGTSIVNSWIQCMNTVEFISQFFSLGGGFDIEIKDIARIASAAGSSSLASGEDSMSLPHSSTSLAGILCGIFSGMWGNQFSVLNTSCLIWFLRKHGYKKYSGATTMSALQVLEIILGACSLHFNSQISSLFECTFERKYQCPGCYNSAAAGKSGTPVSEMSFGLRKISYTVDYTTLASVARDTRASTVSLLKVASFQAQQTRSVGDHYLTAAGVTWRCGNAKCRRNSTSEPHFLWETTNLVSAAENILFYLERDRPVDAESLNPARTDSNNQRLDIKLEFPVVGLDVSSLLGCPGEVLYDLVAVYLSPIASLPTERRSSSTSDIAPRGKEGAQLPPLYVTSDYSAVCKNNVSGNWYWHAGRRRHGMAKEKDAGGSVFYVGQLETTLSRFFSQDVIGQHVEFLMYRIRSTNGDATT